MIAENLSREFPFITKYFYTLFELEKNRFPQSIVFEGLDPYAQLFYSLELARVLNCLEDGETDCQCLNCKWIREGRHPAINFVSQLHFKSSDDDSKTVISAIQAKNIEKSLRETSDYHRFFIFFDAKPTAPDDISNESIQKYSPDGYNIFEEEWSLGHINQKTFNPTTPNILLKSVEEPPERTTFVFLTKNRSDLINTIVSRSQCFKLPTRQKKEDFSFVAQIFSSYPDINLEGAFLISENLQNYVKDSQVSSSKVLDSLLAYLSNEIKQNTDYAYLKKLNRDINFVNEAKRQILSSMSDRVVFDTLLLKMSGGAR